MKIQSLIIIFLIFILSGYGCSGGDDSPGQNPHGSAAVRVGVMLPLTGSGANDYSKGLELALEKINRAGGVAGKKIELVYKDLETEDLMETTRAFAEDESILAVIGPDFSGRAYKAASVFIQASKVMVTPTATSADIFRAFSSYKYIWRTVESDISQVRTMLYLAADKGARRVGLIAADGNYGSTFFDWFGFFATELGLEIVNVHRYDSETDTYKIYLKDLLAKQSDAVFLVPDNPETVVDMVRIWRENNINTRLLFSDIGQSNYIIQELGNDAEGIEGVTLTHDVDHGFSEAFTAFFNEAPTPYAANLYDALILIAYGLERSGGVGGEALADAMIEVVDARGDTVGWDEVAEALSAIGSGNLPDISGATGPLDYDNENHTDIISSTYGHWRIENGAFKIDEYIATGDSETAVNGQSAFRALTSERHMQIIEAGDDIYQPASKTGLWALIVSTSKGWANYRHQADALAHYQLLKEMGVPDERIILILADDLATSPDNQEPGVLRNEVGGPNLYTDVEIDYNLSEINSEKLLAILGGESADELPHVIESGAGDNIYCFIVGHGDESGVYINTEQAIPTLSSYSVLSPASLAGKISLMYQNHRYRQMLIIVEACHGGVMGRGIRTPGVLLFASANPSESSFGSNYDPSYQIWLANAFAYLFFQTARTNPDIFLSDLYRELYSGINGSHVSLYAGSFGTTGEVQLREFITN